MIASNQFEDELKGLRNIVDTADRAILEALTRRFTATDAIGRIKAGEQKAIHDPIREKELRARLQSRAQFMDLDVELVDTLWDVILDFSRKRQYETSS